MLLRRTRKWLALAWLEWRYRNRGEPDTLAKHRRSIGGKYRATNGKRRRVAPTPGSDE